MRRRITAALIALAALSGTAGTITATAAPASASVTADTPQMFVHG